MLALGRFLPIGGVSGGSLIQSGGISTVTEFLSNYVSNILSQNKLGLGVQINYNTYSNVDVTRFHEVQAIITESILNNRFTIEVGGNLQVGAASATVQNNLAGDFELTYKITPDGMLTAKVFSKTQYDYINYHNRNRTGAGFGYQRDFDEFADLFTKKKKRATHPAK